MKARIIVTLLYSVGLIGLIFFPSFFIPLSTFSLLLTVAVLTIEEFSFKKLVLFLFVACSGFFVEWWGVHTGSPFGFYQYGSGLGIKWLDIPLVIGLNWVMLVWSSLALLRWTWNVNNRWILALGGGVLMTLMDVLIEPVAPHLEYWMFEMNQVPWNNYAAWLWLGVLFSWLLSFIPSKQTALGAWVFVLNWLFFVVLNMWYL